MTVCLSNTSWDLLGVLINFFWLAGYFYWTYYMQKQKTPATLFSSETPKECVSCALLIFGVLVSAWHWTTYQREKEDSSNKTYMGLLAATGVIVIVLLLFFIGISLALLRNINEKHVTTANKWQATLGVVAIACYIAYGSLKLAAEEKADNDSKDA